jgi:hypothetical protein
MDVEAGSFGHETVVRREICEPIGSDMPIYFMLLDARLFDERIYPALTESWRRRSFDPCRDLCSALTDACLAFQQTYHTGPAEPIVLQVARGLPFDRHFWQLLAGEIFLFAASEIPEFQQAPDLFARLLVPDRIQLAAQDRRSFSPIQQAHYGSQDLKFGSKTYRPDHAGFNDREDVARLAAYLQRIDTSGWAMEDQEELEDARAWLPPLADMYMRARDQDLIVLCEEL